MDPTPQDIATQDAAYWANLSKIKLQKGVWSFDKRPYLVEPMRRRSDGVRRICLMKGTQGGFSEMEVNQSLWGLIHGHYPLGVLYLFPTTDDMREYSKSRFGPLITANPTAIGRYVQDTDTANLKRVQDAFLFLRGARLSQHLEIDAQESAKLRSISVDKLVFDEYDLMDSEVAGKAQGRLGASEVKEEVYISNPTLPDRGIATLFNQSDQRHWWRRCVHCGQLPPEGADHAWYEDKNHGWTCAELAFPDLVGKDDDGKGYIACRRCGKPVGLEAGLWVPQEPQNTARMRGYRWSQLTSATNDPYEILEQYTNPPDGNLADVVRLRLGKPYVGATDKLTVQQVLACCGTGQQLNSHPGPCAMGVDIRRHKNVVIGCRTGKDNYRIVRVARVETMDDVLQLGYRFHVKVCVGDVRPYEDEMRQFQKKAKFKVWLCEYSDHTPVGTQYSETTGLVKTNRTEVLDATHRLVTSDGMLELPAVCPEVKQFATECAALAKVEMVDKRSHTPVFRYMALDNADSDYRHALAYFWLAASGSHLPVLRDEFARPRQRYANNEYARC